MFWVWGNGDPVTSPDGTIQKAEVNRLFSWNWRACSWGSKITVVRPQPHKFPPNEVINSRQDQMTNEESQVLVCAPVSWDLAFTLTFTFKWQLSGVYFLRRSAIMNCHVRLQHWPVGTKIHIVHCILEFSYLHRQNWSPCAYPLSDWHWERFSSGCFSFPLSISLHLFLIFMFCIPW
jgi:hypothetical protein